MAVSEQPLRFGRRMSDSDALMWDIEQDPMLRSTITAVFVLDRPPDRALAESRLERGCALIPRLAQRVAPEPTSVAPPRWEADPHFDLGYHLRWARAPGEGTLEDVLRMAEPMAMQGFDTARPLWELTVVEGMAGGQAAMVFKLHHSISDGVGSVRLGLVLFDVEPQGARQDEEAPDGGTARPLDPLSGLLDSVGHELARYRSLVAQAPGTLARSAGRLARDPLGSARELAGTLASVARMLSPVGEALSPLMRRRSLSVRLDALSVPVGDLKAAARRAGGRLNDAFVAGVARGLHRYHRHHGVEVERLRVTMPINVRTSQTAGVAGNHFAPARFVVPVAVEDPLAHMAAIRQLVAGQRQEPAIGLVEPLAYLIGRLPTALVTSVFGSLLKGVDFVVSNVPGVPFPVYFAGAKILAQYPFGPLSGAGLNVTLLSYLDQANIGVSSDSAAVADPELLVSCLADGLAEVTKG